MEYEKGSKGKKASLSSVRGMCSYDKNPMQPPAMTESRFGPGMNPDQQKANKLLKEAHAKNESLRGIGVM